MDKRVLLKSELKEWASSQVAEIVIKVLELELKKVYDERASFFLPGEAEKTQEVRSNCLGQEVILQDLIDILHMEPDILDTYFENNGIEIVSTQLEEDIEKYGE